MTHRNKIIEVSLKKILIFFEQQKQPPEVFCKKGVLRNFVKFTGKHLRQSLRLQPCNFIKKEALAQVFSCEFYEISKNTVFYRTPLGDCFYKENEPKYVFLKKTLISGRLSMLISYALFTF